MSAAPPAGSPLHDPVLRWYAESARDLPWRAPGTSPWAVLVSEVMLQQTPVARVEPVYRGWLARWPSPAALAADEPGRRYGAWGRLGYPRRALRLHRAATEVVARHGGELPTAYDELLALPGVGTYTAAAVASFAFGQRHAVLDTNVRRVLVRAAAGRAEPAPSLTAAERRLGEALVPAEPSVAARWAVAVMELGALVCTARSPQCDGCPVRGLCAWQRAGRPPHDGPRGDDRPTRGPTGRCGDCSWRCCGRRPGRYAARRSTPPGRTPRSVTARSPGWSPTVWCSPTATVSGCPGSGPAARRPDRSPVSSR